MTLQLSRLPAQLVCAAAADQHIRNVLIILKEHAVPEAAKVADIMEAAPDLQHLIQELLRSVTEISQQADIATGASINGSLTKLQKAKLQEIAEIHEWAGPALHSSRAVAWPEPSKTSS